MAVVYQYYLSNMTFFLPFLLYHFQIWEPNGVRLEKTTDRDEYHFEFNAEQTGSYKFCMICPTHSAEAVEFNVHIGHVRESYDLESTGDHVKDGKYPYV